MKGSRAVLILGGGVGGLVAANRLARRLPRGHRVTLVDRQPRPVFQPSLLWLATGHRTPEAICRPLTRLAHPRVEVRVGHVEAVDAHARAATVDGQRLEADAVVIGLGADLTPEIVPGLAEAGHNLFAAAGATAFRDAFATFSAGRIVVLTAAAAYKCPAAPYEAAMLIESALRARGLRSRTQLDLYAAEPGPMGVAGPAVTAAVRSMVESRGIAYHPGHQVTAVDAAGRRISFANGTSTVFDLLLYVPPHRAPEAVRNAGLADNDGWVAVDRATFETATAGVYAVGDVTGVPLAIGKPLPKAAVFARAAAEIVADNLLAAWTGRGARRVFDGYGACFVETGDGRAGFGSGNFYAEPAPQISLRPPARWWHWGKMLLERRWLALRP